MSKATILLWQQDHEVRRLWKIRFLQAGFVANDLDPAAENPAPGFDLFVCGESRTDPSLSLQFVQRARAISPTLPIVFVADRGSEQLAVRAFRSGATDYISHASQLEELMAAVRRLHACARGATARLAERAAEPDAEDRIVGDSAIMRQVRGCLARVAVADSSVLITGETGTGKELAAQFIHRSSPRREKPIVCINCAAIPDSLIESELFGHERGAFTGAHCRTAGQLERAEGGTVFLDEVGEMSPFAQAKVLRVIEGKEIIHLGGRAAIRLNVRFVAATNQDLGRLIAENKFRQDLFFRLNIVSVALPALRDHREDIPALLAHYIAEMNRRFGRQVAGLTPDAYLRLLAYHWPGNIRELRNLMEAAFVNLPAEEVTHIDLPAEFAQRMRDPAIPQAERDRLLSALLETHWNKSKAAKQLHWSRMTVYRKIAKYHLCA
jgi:DNA-binding NtrC family response regulator